MQGPESYWIPLLRQLLQVYPRLLLLLFCLLMGLTHPTTDCSNNQLSAREYCSSVLVCLCACEASLSLCPRAEWPADR